MVFSAAVAVFVKHSEYFMTLHPYTDTHTHKLIKGFRTRIPVQVIRAVRLYAYIYIYMLRDIIQCVYYLCTYNIIIYTHYPYMRVCVIVFHAVGYHSLQCSIWSYRFIYNIISFYKRVVSYSVAGIPIYTYTYNNIIYLYILYGLNIFERLSDH